MACVNRRVHLARARQPTRASQLSTSTNRRSPPGSSIGRWACPAASRYSEENSQHTNTRHPSAAVAPRLVPVPEHNLPDSDTGRPRADGSPDTRLTPDDGAGSRAARAVSRMWVLLLHRVFAAAVGQ